MPSRSEWNRAAEGEPDLPVAVPAEVEHRRLRGQQPQAGLEPGRGRAWCGRRGPGRRLPRRGARTRRPTPPRRRPDGSTSTRVTCAPGMPAATFATQHPTMPAPTTLTRSPTRGGASQRALTAVSTVPPAPPGAAGRRPGTGYDGRGGHDVARLVRVQAEHGPPLEVARALLDDADVEVPVLHRTREVALLERRPHPGVLVRGTSPRKTRASVPRLTPDRRARTRTSSSPGTGMVALRSSPTPGARIQNATASGVTRVLDLPRR